MSSPQLPGLPILPSSPKEKDPVCGMMVDPQKPAAKYAYKGKTYYFCSTRCAERFQKEPERFLVAPGKAGMEHAMGAAHVEPAAPPAARKNVRYTCPMDPEIVQIGPGICPKCGMALEPMDFIATLPGEDQPDPEYDSMRRRFWVSAALSLPLLVFSMFGEALGLHLEPATKNSIELLLASPVVLWCGWPFFQRFWVSLVNRSPNMFTLIGLGTGAAYLYSVAATLFSAILPGVFPRHARRRGCLFRGCCSYYHVGVARSGSGIAGTPAHQRCHPRTIAPCAANRAPRIGRNGARCAPRASQAWRFAPCKTR